MPQIQFVERVVDFPVVRQRRVPTVQTVQLTAETHQVTFLELVLDMPVVVHQQVRGRRSCAHAATSSSNMTVGVPQFQFIDRVVASLWTETGTQRQTVGIPLVQFLDKLFADCGFWHIEC